MVLDTPPDHRSLKKTNEAYKILIASTPHSSSFNALQRQRIGTGSLAPVIPTYKNRVRSGGLTDDWIEVHFNKGSNNPEPSSAVTEACVKYESRNVPRSPA
jgi:hypothetical protein